MVKRLGSNRRVCGFTFVWVLASIAVVSLGLAVVGPVWAEQVRREREQDLLRIGTLYAQAIHSYYLASPGSIKRYPPTLDSLLLDSRFVGNLRHLRKLYRDPLDPTQPWGLVRHSDGGIQGVYSFNTASPVRKAQLDLGVVVLPPAEQYSDWKFVPRVSP